MKARWGTMLLVAFFLLGCDDEGPSALLEKPPDARPAEVPPPPAPARPVVPPPEAPPRLEVRSAHIVRIDGTKLTLQERPLPTRFTLEIVFSLVHPDRAALERSGVLFQGTTAVGGSYSWNADGTVVTFSPRSLLAVETSYTIRLSLPSFEGSFVTRTPADFNGDGAADIVLAATGFQQNRGLATVQSGRRFEDELFRVVGEGVDHFLGRGVAFLGDINQDGYDDLGVGAPGNAPFPGAAYLFLGQRERAALRPGQAFASYKGSAPGEQLGKSIAALGDINGDGFADVALGAPLAQNGPLLEAGAIFLIDGARPATPAAVIRGARAMQLGARIVALSPDASGRPRFAVGAAVDRQGQGTIFIFAGRSFDNRTSDQASAQIKGIISTVGLFGDAFDFIDDVNGDGVGDLAAVDDAVSGGNFYLFSGALLTEGAELSTAQAMATLRGSGESYFRNIAGIGDIDADGCADIAVGSQFYGNTQGVVFFFSGARLRRNLAVTPPATTIDGLLARRLGVTGDQFGASLASVGDLNGDGRTDVAIGSPGVNNAAGRVTLFGGSELGRGAAPSPQEILGTAANLPAGSLLGRGVAGKGVVRSREARLCR